MSIALVPPPTPAPESLQLVILAARWAHARADRAHLIAQGAGMVPMRVAESRVAVHTRILNAALADAVPGYDPADLAAVVEEEDQHDHDQP